MTNKSDGSTASYYELPPGCTELQDLISHRNMNAQDGEIFRAIYRKGRASHSDELRDAKKVLFYAQAEVKRLESLQPRKISDTYISVSDSPKQAPIYTGLRCYVCGQQGGHGGLQCPTMRPMSGSPESITGTTVLSASFKIEPASLIDDESPRQQLIQQGGEMAAEVYSEIDRLRAAEAFNADLPVSVEEAVALGAVPQREPCQPRHRCQTCAGGHATHLCAAGT